MKSSEITLRELFDKQVENQKEILKKGKYEGFKMDETASVPADDPRLCSYHVQHLISEIGEVLDADKRWKNFRNEKYDKDAKTEEVADCFIVLMNIAMFSGIDGDELAEAISTKISAVSKRVDKE